MSENSDVRSTLTKIRQILSRPEPQFYLAQISDIIAENACILATLINYINDKLDLNYVDSLVLKEVVSEFTLIMINIPCYSSNLLIYTLHNKGLG